MTPLETYEHEGVTVQTPALDAPRTDWVTFALILGLTAPTDTAAQEAAALAEDIAVGLTADEIEACKNATLAATDGAPR